MRHQRIAALAGAVAAAATVAMSAGPATSMAEARGCHSQGATNLFLRYGISTVRVQHMRCRRAVRTLRRWARAGMPGTGPSGWRCRSGRLNPQAQRVRCSRAGRRMRFDVGGGAALAAAAKSCGSLSVRRYHGIKVYNGVTCKRAARKIRRWSRAGHHFPTDPFGLWHCDMKPRRKLCSNGNGNAPYFTFLERHRR
jgi:hypothetical protein